MLWWPSCARRMTRGITSRVPLKANFRSMASPCRIALYLLTSAGDERDLFAFYATTVHTLRQSSQNVKPLVLLGFKVVSDLKPPQKIWQKSKPPFRIEFWSQTPQAGDKYQWYQASHSPWQNLAESSVTFRTGRWHEIKTYRLIVWSRQKVKSFKCAWTHVSPRYYTPR